MTDADPTAFDHLDAVAMLAGLVEDGRAAGERLAERRAVEAAVLRDFAAVTEHTAPAESDDPRMEGARHLILGAADMARQMAAQLEDARTLIPLRAMIEQVKRPAPTGKDITE